MNTIDDNKEMANWWAEKKYTFPSFNDADNLANACGIKAMPSSIVIGPEGMIRHAAAGSAHEFEKQIKAALTDVE